MYLGPSISVAHRLVPASMRALTSAVFFLVINFIGLGFGPLVVGMISDMLKPALGVESLRWAMSIIKPSKSEEILVIHKDFQDTSIARLIRQRRRRTTVN